MSYPAESVQNPLFVGERQARPVNANISEIVSDKLENFHCSIIGKNLDLLRKNLFEGSCRLLPWTVVTIFKSLGQRSPFTEAQE
jgi:hypothetical protein